MSPDPTWQARDSSFRRWEGDPCASQDYIDREYSLLNFQTGQKLLPGLRSNRYVDWVGWAGNSETFNLVSRPAHPSSVPDPNLPFGLITLAPATGNMQLRFEQAVFAALNPDQTRARVVFPARHGDGTLDYPIPTQADTWSSAARQACGDW